MTILKTFGQYSYNVVTGASIGRAEPWPVPVIVGLGFIFFGLQIGSTAIVRYASVSILRPYLNSFVCSMLTFPFSYVVDCYRDKAAEVWTLTSFFLFRISNFHLR